MKWFIDGDQVVVTHDDFINLQESPAVFVPVDSEMGKTIKDDGIIYLPMGDLIEIRNRLETKED